MLDLVSIKVHNSQHHTRTVSPIYNTW